MANREIRTGTTESGQFMTIDELSKRPGMAVSSGVCVNCGSMVGRSHSSGSEFVCSLCHAPLCEDCMSIRRFEIRGPLKSQMTRLGLEQFSGVKNSFSLYSYAPPGSFYVLEPGYYMCHNCVEFANSPALMTLAMEYCEKTGRLEELAELYEYLGRFADAKSMRMKALAPSTTELNALIDKIKDGGLVIPYKCPSCGADINISKDSDAAGLRYCSYCGTAVNTDALVNPIEAFLR